MTNKAKKEIAHLVDEQIIEDIYFVVDMYREYNLGRIIEEVAEAFKEYPIVEEGEIGIVVFVALNSIDLKEFKSRVLL